MWLCPDEYNIAIKAFLSQRNGGCASSQIGPDNDILLLHEMPPSFV